MIEANNRHTERSSTFSYFKGYCFSCNMFGHKAINSYRWNMKHIICYDCNKYGHIAKECRRKIQPTFQKEQSSSHFKVWNKKEVQLEICGIAQYTDRIDSRETESMKFQCSISHTQLS